jgi:dipeptidase E
MEDFVLSQDVIYVGGGNTATMLASWRVLGLDEILRKAWRLGVILTGLSAGSLCWFESGPSDSWTPAPAQDGAAAELRPVAGLGFLPGSHCPHYDGEVQRRPAYQQLVRDGLLPDGYAADDGAALVFRETRLEEVVSSRPNAQGWRVERVESEIKETSVATRFLGTNGEST